MKNLIKILILFIPSLISAQAWDGRARWDETPSNQVALMIGNKAAEVSATFTHSLIFGGAVAVVDSKMVEKRANRNDRGTSHKINSKYTPAVFGLIGGEFEELSIIGKLGASYVDQDIKGKNSKDIFFAVGVAIDYKINNAIGLRGSYDNVSGVMAGLTFHFNN